MHRYDEAFAKDTSSKCKRCGASSQSKAFPQSLQHFHQHNVLYIDYFWRFECKKNHHIVYNHEVLIQPSPVRTDLAWRGHHNLWTFISQTDEKIRAWSSISTRTLNLSLSFYLSTIHFWWKKNVTLFEKMNFAIYS